MTTLRTQVKANFRQSKRRAFSTASALLLATSGLMFLAGCSGMVNDGLSSATGGAMIQGNVHGGQQPISGATIQLYSAAHTGYADAATPLLTTTVTSGADGSFNITSDYTCPSSPDDMVYLTATGGDPGAGANANSVLMAALGPCSALSGSTFIMVNEVSTVAAAYALSGFMTDATHVGASSTNYQGLKNAFATVTNLVDLSAGAALSVTPAYQSAPTGTDSSTFRSVVPQAELNTLANILAACVNTNGSGGSSPACDNLFVAAKPPAGSTPTTTLQAAVDIAKNPGNNVSTLFNLASATPPFSPGLSSAPNDWTVAVNFVGGGIGGPSSPVSEDATSSDLAIDATGNIWISNWRTSTVTQLTNLGAPLSNSTVLTPSYVGGGYTGGGVSNPNAIAVDTTGNVWTGNGNGTISKMTSAGAGVGSGFSGGGVSGSVRRIAIDGSDNVWAVGSYNAVAKFDSNGTALSGLGYSGNINTPTGALSLDDSGDVWVVNGGSQTVVKIKNADGSLLYTSSAAVTAGTPYGSADGLGGFWVPQGSPNHSMSLFKTSSNVATATATPTSINNPVSTSVDGVGHVWVVNAGGALGVLPNLTELSGTGSTLSPSSTGFRGTGTALISSPQGSGVDGSGNLWLANGINVSTVTEFVGVAAPTVTPLSLAVKNAKIGTLP